MNELLLWTGRSEGSLLRKRGQASSSLPLLATYGAEFLPKWRVAVLIEIKRKDELLDEVML